MALTETKSGTAQLKRELAFPRPDSIPFFHHPNPEAAELLQPAVDQFGGSKHILAAIGYGSYFFGQPTPNSRVDMILITPDVQAFHEDQMKHNPDMYGLPHIPSVHAFYDRIGPTPYRTEFGTITGEPVRGKIMVISKERFVDQCRGGVVNGLQERRLSPWDIYMQGRMQKHDLTPLTDIPKDIQDVITQARINGVALSIGLLPDQFNWQQLASMVISLSYKADVRLENPQKQQTILEKAAKGYEAMVTAIADGFVDTGVLMKIDGGYVRRKKIRREPIASYLRTAKPRATVANYGKNWIAGGIGSGLVYVKEKAIRALS